MPHSHSHPEKESRRSLIIALFITGIVFVVELVAGFLTNSLALIADSGHMLTDLAALTVSLFALKISARPANHQKTYGYRRVEILAALANGLTLVLVSFYIFYEAFHRFVSPQTIDGVPMLAVASIGLVANIVTLAVLQRSQRGNLNLRGAFLHVIGDALGSLGAITAGIAVVVWRWYPADSLVSVIVAVFVLYSSWRLIRESLDILLEATPAHLDISKILALLGGVAGVVSIHDLHVWSITSGLPAMSCHVIVQHGEDPSRILADLSRLMRNRFEIAHTTMQIEREQMVVPTIGDKPIF